MARKADHARAEFVTWLAVVRLYWQRQKQTIEAIMTTCTEPLSPRRIRRALAALTESGALMREAVTGAASRYTPDVAKARAHFEAVTVSDRTIYADLHRMTASGQLQRSDNGYQLVLTDEQKARLFDMVHRWFIEISSSYPDHEFDLESVFEGLPGLGAPMPAAAARMIAAGVYDGGGIELLEILSLLMTKARTASLTEDDLLMIQDLLTRYSLAA